MKNKFKLIIMLFVFACLSLSVGFACSKEPPAPIQINGFDESVIVSEITVNAGENVSIQSPLVIDEFDNVLDVHVAVSDAFGGFVEVKANKFFALDNEGYTIKYIVQTYDGNIHERTTKVNVLGSFYLGVDMQQVYFLDDTVTLNAMHRLDNPTISFAVKAPDGTDVALTENTFEATQSGFYNVTVTATEGGRTYNYDTQVFVREFKSDYVYGAVEVFDENWEIIRKLDGYGKQNWTLTNTAETGVLGPKGTNDWFLMAKTVTGWQGGLDFWLNPIFAKENYEKLVDQGFTHIVLPIMQVGGTSNGTAYTFTAGHVQNDTSYTYQKHLGGLPQNVWNEIKIPLVDNYQDWYRSFVSCYDIYANQIAQILRISTGGGNCTYYLGSIYALQNKTLKGNDLAKDVAFGVGHTVEDLGAYVGENPDKLDLEYRVLFRGEETIIKAPTEKDAKTPYSFNANGEYVVSVVPARKDFNGGFNFTVTVSDETSISFSETSDLEYPRDPSSARLVNFADLGIILKDAQGEVIDDVSYEVYFDGSRIDSAELDFSAAKDGKYTVVAVGKYGENKAFTTYKEAIVNVYSTTNIGIIDKVKTTSVNVADKINVMMEYAPQKQFVSYKMFKIIGPNEIEVADAPIAADGTLAISDLASGYYKIYATDTNNADDVAYIDVWSSDEGHQFNVVDESTLDYVHAYKIYSWGDKDYGVIDDVSVSEDGKFFVVDFPSRGNSSDNTIKVYPIHSFGYYEQFKGLDGVIYFDYYFESEQKITSYRPIGTSGRPNVNSGIENKMTLSVSLDELLDNWAVYNSKKTDDAYTFLIKELGWVWSEAKDNLGPITMYVGNFSFTYVEKAELEDATINLVDVSKLEGNTFDVSTIISDAGKALLAKNEGEAFVYKLVDNGKNVTTLSSTVITLTEANERAYALNVYYANGLLAYQGHVDFYNSTKDPVWNVVSEDTTSFVVSHARTSCSSSSAFEKEGVQSIATIDGVQYVLSQFATNIPGRSHVVTSYPLHSKVYYELYADYSFTFDAYLGYPEKGADGKFIKAPTDVHFYGQANGSWRPGKNGVTTSVDTGLSEKLTYTISLSSIVEHWSEYMSGKPDGKIHNTSGEDFDFLISNCMEAWRETPWPTQIYVGNFQLTKNA